MRKKLDDPVSLAIVKAALPPQCKTSFAAMRFDILIPAPELHLPPDPDNMNEERALAALAVVEYFASTSMGEAPAKRALKTEQRELLHQNLKDMVGDFAHLCDRVGLDMSAILQGAANHYRSETDERGKQFGGAL